MHSRDMDRGIYPHGFIFIPGIYLDNRIERITRTYDTYYIHTYYSLVIAQYCGPSVSSIDGLGIRLRAPFLIRRPVSTRIVTLCICVYLEYSLRDI